MDELIEKWHSFADQSLDEIAQNFNAEGLTLLDDVLHEILGRTDAAQYDTASAFAKFVVDLRENERAWSRSLVAAIIQAHELFGNGDPHGSESKLFAFVSVCPWRNFVEVADVQRQNFRA